MTDSRLQQLKRAWEASGSVEDEAVLLRERVRVGDLAPGRVKLAAFFGKSAAQTIFPEQGVLPLREVASLLDVSTSEVRSWLKKGCPAASRKGKRSVFEASSLFVWLASERTVQQKSPYAYRFLGAFLGSHAAYAGLKICAVAMSRALGRQEGFEEYKDKFRVFEDWLACPCASHSEACRSTLQIRAPHGFGFWGPRYETEMALDQGTHALAVQATQYEGVRAEGMTSQMLFSGLATISDLEPSEILESSGRELVPWLLEARVAALSSEEPTKRERG